MQAKDLRKMREAWRKRFLAEKSQRKQSAEEARSAAEKCAQILAKQFGVKKVYLFGSAKNSAVFHKKSDIDLAVEGLSSEKYFPALSRLMTNLPDGLEIDLIPLEDAFPELIRIVKNEGELLYEKQ